MRTICYWPVVKKNSKEERMAKLITCGTHGTIRLEVIRVFKMDNDDDDDDNKDFRGHPYGLTIFYSIQNKSQNVVYS